MQPGGIAAIVLLALFATLALCSAMGGGSTVTYKCPDGYVLLEKFSFTEAKCIPGMPATRVEK